MQLGTYPIELVLRPRSCVAALHIHTRAGRKRLDSVRLEERTWARYKRGAQLSTGEHEALLIYLGFSPGEVNAACRAAAADRKDRRLRSIASLGLHIGGPGYLRIPEVTLTTAASTLFTVALVDGFEDSCIKVFSSSSSPAAYWWPRLFGSVASYEGGYGAYYEANERGRRVIREIFTAAGLNPNPIASLKEELQ